jgi:peroxiredoxin/outer membrane lipoprotein-sorting protein
MILQTWRKHMHSILIRHGFPLAMIVLLIGTAPLAGQEAAPIPQTQPAGQPQALPPQTPPPSQQPVALRPLDPKVQQVLAQSRDAYKAVKTYQDLGSVTTTMVVGGRPAESTAPASTTFERPQKFIVNYQAMSLYSDGSTLSIYSPARGRYYQQPLDQPPPAAGTAMTAQSILKNLPVLPMLGNPDLSLLSTTTAFESTYRGREQLAGKAVDHVTLVSPADTWFGATDAPASGADRVTIDMFLDAQTHMLLRLNMDLSGAMRSRITQLEQQRESPQLNQATWQFNAGQVRLNSPIADGTFTFQPPADAVPVETVAALFSPTGGRAPINDEEEAEKREAEQSRLPYPAPDFALKDLAGETVKLSDLRGKVVVMDFWATWCGPCRLSLPHIQKLHDDLRDRGVVVLAIDLGEDTKTVLGYAEKNKMTLRVLLDEEDQVSPLYRVSAIPHTVVVDQKGQVVKVYTGFMPGQEKVLRSEVEALLAGASSQPAVQPAAGRPASGAATQPAIRASVVATQPKGAGE